MPGALSHGTHLLQLEASPTPSVRHKNAQNEPTSHPAAPSTVMAESPTRSVHTPATSVADSVFNMRSVSQLAQRDVIVSAADITARLPSPETAPQAAPHPAQQPTRWPAFLRRLAPTSAVARQQQSEHRPQHDGAPAAPPKPPTTMVSRLPGFCIPHRSASRYVDEGAARGEQPSNGTSGIGSAMLPVPAWLRAFSAMPASAPHHSTAAIARLAPFTVNPLATLHATPAPASAVDGPRHKAQLGAWCGSRHASASTSTHARQARKSWTDDLAPRWRITCAVLLVAFLLLFAVIAVVIPLTIAQRRSGGAALAARRAERGPPAMEWLTGAAWDSVGKVTLEVDRWNVTAGERSAQAVVEIHTANPDGFAAPVRQSATPAFLRQIIQSRKSPDCSVKTGRQATCCVWPLTPPLACLCVSNCDTARLSALIASIQICVVDDSQKLSAMDGADNAAV